MKERELKNDTVHRLFDTSPLDLLRLARRSFNSPRRGEQKGLDPKQRAELALMRQDLSHAGPPFTPSSHWQEVVTGFDALFRREGIPNPEEQSYNLRFSGFARSDPRLHRYVCWMYYQNLKKRDQLDLLTRLKATCKVEDGFAYMFEGKSISLDLLLSIDDFYSLLELVPQVAKEPIVVGELGAGWGRLGYVLCRVNPRCTYVIFDLPEVLVISQNYLPALLSTSATTRYETARKHEQLDRSTLEKSQLWFFGPQHMDKFTRGSVDVVVNIASFQEMPKTYVAKYLELFSRIAVRGSCFLRQLRSGKSHGHKFDEIDGFDAYPIPAYWDRVFLRTTTISDEFVEAGYRIGEQLAGE
jgi:putative sugar O-methyltransferase